MTDMAGKLAHNFRIRRSFGHIEKIVEFPHLLEISATPTTNFSNGCCLLTRGLMPDSKGFFGPFSRSKTSTRRRL